MADSRELFTGEVSEYATARVPTASTSETVKSARSAMVGRTFDLVDEIVVLSEGKLVGLVALSDLLEASDESSIGDLMDRDPVILRAGASEEGAAWAMVRRQQRNLAIAEPDRTFVGLVPSDKLMGRLLTEHDDDVDRKARGDQPLKPPGIVGPD